MESNLKTTHEQAWIDYESQRLSAQTEADALRAVAQCRKFVNSLDNYDLLKLILEIQCHKK